MYLLTLLSYPLTDSFPSLSTLLFYFVLFLSPLFPSEIGLCRQLAFLQLQHNELTEIPSSVGDLTSLRRLGLQYNKLSELPVSLCQCTQITEIALESNVLTSLPVSNNIQRIIIIHLD